MFLKLHQPPTSSYTVVWEAGKGGYHTYRIPVVIATTEGTLLAFAEGRKGGQGDAGNIDLLVKRSSDNGQTWSDPLLSGTTEQIHVATRPPLLMHRRERSTSS